jgi:ubiquinone/menaquinone biosynthesis C-methylase UbiE
MPEAALAGVDINTRALQAARTALAQVGARVRLAHGSASALSMLDRASVDIVITDAVLMYVGPDRISKAIGEIVRVMRRGAVLVEWHMPPGDATDNTSRTHFGHWIHDYRALFAGYGCDDVVVTPLPAAAWDDAGWRRFGALIEVRVPSC